MSIGRRLRTLSTEHGLYGVTQKLIGLGFDQWFEKINRLDTLGAVQLSDLEIDGLNKANATSHYEASRFLPIRSLLRAAKSLIGSPVGLVDCGSGKGKVLLVGMEARIPRITGVEFSSLLCKVAEANIGRYRQRIQYDGKVNVLNEDVGLYCISTEDNLFFLFNPFNATVLQGLIENIARSHQNYPRQIVIAIAFMNSQYRDVFSQQSLFKLHSQPVFWGCQFSLFSNFDQSKSLAT